LVGTEVETGATRSARDAGTDETKHQTKKPDMNNQSSSPIGTDRISDLRLTPTGPVARIDGIWHSVNTWEGMVDEVRFALRPEEITSLGLAPNEEVISRSARLLDIDGFEVATGLVVTRWSDEDGEYILINRTLHSMSDVLEEDDRLTLLASGATVLL
jgi:hypothetical protein